MFCDRVITRMDLITHRPIVITIPSRQLGHSKAYSMFSQRTHPMCSTSHCIHLARTESCQATGEAHSTNYYFYDYFYYYSYSYSYHQ